MRSSRPADTISLAVVLSGGERREESKRTFADAIRTLYGMLGASAPAGLSRAIQREANYRAPAGTRPGAVFSAHWREGSKVLWLRVSRPAPRPTRR